MQRQKSILSFLLKPSPGNQDSGDPSSFSDALPRRIPAKGPLSEIRGADTPPEKIQGSFFRAADADDSNTPSPFSNIMHKFAREQDRSGGGSSARSCRKSDNRTSLSSYPKFGGFDETCINMKSEMPAKDFSQTYSMFSDHCSGENPPDCEISSDIMGPETPATRPVVPRLKRVHTPGSDVKHEVLASGKRVKSIQDTMNGNMAQVEMSDSHGSKFEWLKPLYIRDGNGRRPCDSLYDKRTLYIPPDALKKMSATQKQYWNVKCQYMDVILFFKVGKFYELYELDAEIGHKELDWKMTISGVGKCRQVGISEAGIDDAVQKLIARGYKVGRIEQLETSDQAKARGVTSVIERKLVHVSTPSTTVDGNMGPNAVHLLALKEDLENGSPRYGFAFLDYAALKFWVGSISDDASCAALGALLMQVSPKEVVYESSGFSKDAYKALVKYASAGSTNMQLTPTMPNMNLSDPSEVQKQINSRQYFRGCPTALTSAFENTEHHDLILCALGALVGHLNRLKLDDALLNGELLPYHVYKSCLRMDGPTLVNLEIFSNNVDGSSSGTLYKHLDHCITSSGKRLLWRWICHPLKDIDEINDRLNIVEWLTKQSGVVSIMTRSLCRLPDLERLLGRVKATVGSSSTLLLPFVGVKLLKRRIKAFGTLVKGLRIGIDLLICLQKEDRGILSLAKVVNIPVLNELDTLLKQFEAALEDDFPQYQDHNVKDSDAESLAILVDLFNGKASEWSLVIHALNCVDVLQSFANTAISSCGSMSRPVLVPADSHAMISQQKNKGSTLKIKGLWHPYAVGESGNGVVPNDIYLGEGTTAHHPRALLLTGPNMGGKSTLLRATCLAVILAQIGCYVPCDMCMLSPADIIFTRLGATDRIMSGESTFFVECSETASVLQHATQDSLVLLDELGRGTSTFDGYAIAYAVFRHLVETTCCRLLFATHYHPLTKEFASHPQVNLQHMACSFRPKSGTSFEGQSELVFLYQLAPGACSESYGLQVACIAGIPPQVIEGASKASQRMKHMISGNFKSSEERSAFSTLHEEWLKTLLALSKTEDSCWSEDDSDTLLCLWHEMKGFYRPNGNGN